MAPSRRSLAAVALVGLAAPAAAVVYNYNNGGQDWSTTIPLCGTGMNQSPINVATPVVTYNAPLGPLRVQYSSSTAWSLEVTANYLEIADIVTPTSPGGTAAVNSQDGLYVDGTFIPLNQFHFHTPSEHTIDGMHFPLEMHMVHKLFNASNPAQLLKAAVIGVMFAYDPFDQPGPFMSKFQSVFQQMTVAGADSSDTIATNVTANPGTSFNLMTDVFGPQAAGTAQYYRYNGSLTTPGCNEGIFWHLMNTPLYLSRAQLLSFTKTLATEQGGMSRGADNRLIQPLNGRTILASFPNPTKCKNKWYKNKNTGKWQYGCLTTPGNQVPPAPTMG